MTPLDLSNIAVGGDTRAPFVDHPIPSKIMILILDLAPTLLCPLAFPSRAPIAIEMKRWLLVAAVLGSIGIRWHDATAAEPSKPKILFFSKSSGFEHEVIKRHGEKPSFAEQVLSQIERTNNF